MSEVSGALPVTPLGAPMRQRLMGFFVLMLLCACTTNPFVTQTVPIAIKRPITLGNGPTHGLVYPGQTIVFRILSDSSRGNQWTLSMSLKAKTCLTVLRDGEFEPALTPIPAPAIILKNIGTPKIQEWVLQANCPGSFLLQWNNLRPWEMERLPISTHQMRITIQ